MLFVTPPLQAFHAAYRVRAVLSPYTSPILLLSKTAHAWEGWPPLLECSNDGALIGHLRQHCQCSLEHPVIRETAALRRRSWLRALTVLFGNSLESFLAAAVNLKAKYHGKQDAACRSLGQQMHDRHYVES